MSDFGEMADWLKKRGEDMAAWNRLKSKYRAVRSNGFASKLESAVRDILGLREKAGEISDIRCQHGFEFPCGPRWKIDFSFTDLNSGETVFAEAKGAELETYRLKRRMFTGCPLLESRKLEIWKGDYRNPQLVETIAPKCHQTRQDSPGEEIGGCVQPTTSER